MIFRDLRFSQRDFVAHLAILLLIKGKPTLSDVFPCGERVIPCEEQHLLFELQLLASFQTCFKALNLGEGRGGGEVIRNKLYASIKVILLLAIVWNLIKYVWS